MNQTDKNVVRNGVFETDMSLSVLAVFEASFTGKDGQSRPYYRAVTMGNRKAIELTITKELFCELQPIVPSTIECTAIVDLNYSKVRLDTIH